MAGADSVIPPPLDDDDDDVAWALQTAAVQWARGSRADAVVWLRRAVDAAIAAGNPRRTKDLTRLAARVADRLVEEAARAPDSAVPPAPSRPAPDDVDDLLAPPRGPVVPPRGSVPRPSAHSLSGEIPIDFSEEAGDDAPEESFDDAADLEDDDDDDAPTIPPPRDAAAVLLEPPSRFLEKGVVPNTVDDSGHPFDSRAPRPSEDTDIVSAGEIWSAHSSAPPDDEELVGAHEVWSAPPAEAHAPPEPPEAPTRGPLPADEPEFDGPTSPRHALVSEPAPEPVPSPPSEPPFDGPAVVGGIALDSVRGFEDLPEEMQSHLASRALLTTLAADEEVGSFGAALVTNGKVGIMPSIADVASAVASVGEVVFTRGSLPDGVALRVVALEDDTVVASWTGPELEAAFADCPWVADELRLVADRFQAIAGATLGLLGERLDDALRGLVLSRMEVKAFGPGEIIVTEGKAVPGLHVVGGGKVEFVEGDVMTDEATPGDFLFAAEVLSAGKAHATARAGKSGAIVLFASRAVAHEMLMSVPPLLEILAG
jgi:CRP-like cAMP-binding protein